MNYKIRYIEIESNEILNYLDFLRNTDDLLQSSGSQKNFFIDLENSIDREGIRNPILVSALEFTRFKDNYAFFKQKKFKKRAFLDYELERGEKMLICDYQGGSRLWVAQKKELIVQCIVLDFCNLFKDKHTCNNIDCIQSHFVDNININIKKNSLEVQYFRTGQS